MFKTTSMSKNVSVLSKGGRVKMYKTLNNYAIFYKIFEDMTYNV